MVEGLYEALTNNNLTDVVGIIVDESSSLSRATDEYSTWLPQVQDKVRPDTSTPPCYCTRCILIYHVLGLGTLSSHLVRAS